MKHFAVLVIGPSYHGQMVRFGAGWKYGDCMVNADGDWEEVPPEENPRFEWYSLGGYWRGAIRLLDDFIGQGCYGSPGVVEVLLDRVRADNDRCDRCEVRMIDWDAMEVEGEPWVPAAVVKDGKWIEGPDGGRKSLEEWRAEFAGMVKGLADFELVSLVDCKL